MAPPSPVGSVLPEHNVTTHANLLLVPRIVRLVTCRVAELRALAGVVGDGADAPRDVRRYLRSVVQVVCQAASLLHCFHVPAILAGTTGMVRTMLAAAGVAPDESDDAPVLAAGALLAHLRGTVMGLSAPPLNLRMELAAAALLLHGALHHEPA